MMKFVSPIEIWTDRRNPKILFRSKKTKFEFQHSRSCYYLDKSNIIALLTPCLRQNHYDLLYVLIDLTKEQFAIINAPDFDLKELGNNEIKLVLNFRYSYDQAAKDKIAMDDGKIIYLNKLAWHGTDILDNKCKLK